MVEPGHWLWHLNRSTRGPGRSGRSAGVNHGAAGAGQGGGREGGGGTVLLHHFDRWRARPRGFWWHGVLRGGRADAASKQFPRSAPQARRLAAAPALANRLVPGDDPRLFGRPGPGLAGPLAAGELTFELYPQDWTFKKGHRIRLEISSSNFPRVARNLNTGAPNPYSDDRIVVAEQTIFHSFHDEPRALGVRRRPGLQRAPHEVLELVGRRMTQQFGARLSRRQQGVVEQVVAGNADPDVADPVRVQRVVDEHGERPAGDVYGHHRRWHCAGPPRR